MIEKIKKYITDDEVSTSRIDVIAGIRVLAIGLIAWFHIWQQSWLSPYLRIGNIRLNFMPLPRAGYLWVDMFILLSAFQLFLPHARQMVSGTDTISTKEFYIRRAKRILPSYVLSVLICLYFAVFSGNYASMNHMLKDLITHLTFTHTFFADTYLFTQLNVVLWTVAILVQFYLIFPFIAKAFKKYSTLTFVLLCTAGITYRIFFVNGALDPALFLNQLPAFLDVFAIGMFGAYAFVLLNEKVKYQRLSPVFTILSVASFCLIFYAMKLLSQVADHTDLQHWQGINRTWVALAFLLFVISTAYSMKWYRFIFSNKIAVFLSTIAFNFYIWHQYIAVKLKLWNFPYSEFETPNMAGDIRWQWQYTIACFLISIAFSIFVTYVYERAIRKFIARGMPQKTSMHSSVRRK